MDNIVYKNGNISTLMPQQTVKVGERAKETFFWTKNPFINTAEEYTINDTIGFHNVYDTITPTVGDYIVYTEAKNIYIYVIKNINGTKITADVLDSIKIADVDVNDAASISISVTSVVKEIYVNDIDWNNLSVVEENAVYSKCNPIMISRKSNALNNFNVVSLNDNSLGSYKITLEFYTDLISPAMDSMIVSKFTDSSLDYTKSQEGTYIMVPDTSCTYRGYFGMYTRRNRDRQLPPNINEPTDWDIDFDAEKLDNFSIIIKDYDDGIGKKSFNKDVPIIKKIFTEKANYKCFCCIYTKNVDGTVNRSVMSEINVYDLMK